MPIPPLSSADHDLRTLLQRNDPANDISLRHCAELEMRITAAILDSAQMTHSKRDLGFVGTLGFPLPPYRVWQWPVIGAVSVVFGLLIGIGISVLSEPPVQHYTVATALSSPWY